MPLDFFTLMANEVHVTNTVFPGNVLNNKLQLSLILLWIEDFSI